MKADRFPSTRIPHSQFVILVQQFEESMRFASETTRHVYRKALDQLAAYAKITPFRFTPTDFTQFRLWLFNRKKLSTNTVNTYLTASRRFCEFLMELGVLKKNPAWSVHGTAQDFNRLGVRLADVEKAVESPDRKTVVGKRDRAFMLLMMECGATISELINADVDDLRQTPSGFEVRVKPKGGRPRTDSIPLTSPAEEAIRSYLSSRGGPSGKEPLFTVARKRRSSGMRFSPRGVRAAMRRYLHFKDDRDIPLNSLRTYCGLRLISQGKSPDEVRAFMRFRSNMPLRKILGNSQTITSGTK